MKSRDKNSWLPNTDQSVFPDTWKENLERSVLNEIPLMTPPNIGGAYPKPWVAQPVSPRLPPNEKKKYEIPSTEEHIEDMIQRFGDWVKDWWI